MPSSSEVWHVLAAIRELHEEVKKLREEVKSAQSVPTNINFVFPVNDEQYDSEASSPQSTQSEP